MNSNFDLLPPLLDLEPVGTNTPGDLEVFVPKGVCSKMIRFSVEDGKVAHVDFTGGCDGNLKAVSALVTGMEVGKVLDTLTGITCGRKSTSCADQLCQGLRQYMNKSGNTTF